MWCSIRYRDPAPTRDICAYNSRQATKVGDPEKDVYDQPAALREHGKLLLPLDQSLASFRHALLKPDLFLAFTQPCCSPIH